MAPDNAIVNHGCNWFAPPHLGIPSNMAQSKNMLIYHGVHNLLSQYSIYYGTERLCVLIDFRLTKIISLSVYIINQCKLQL